MPRRDDSKTSERSSRLSRRLLRKYDDLTGRLLLFHLTPNGPLHEFLFQLPLFKPWKLSGNFQQNKAAHHLAVAAVHSPGQQQVVFFFCFPQTLLLQCKYNLDLSLERPATESCGGLSMTKDNQANVDEVEDALKKKQKPLKLSF